MDQTAYEMRIRDWSSDVSSDLDFSRLAWFDEIGATGRALQPISLVLAAPDSSPSFRHRLSAYIQTQLDGGAGAIAATLATGDRGAISEEDAEAMRRSGLAHLLSISGLHVSAFIGAVLLLVFRSEEHTSELQSLMRISYAVFCLKKKKK